MQERVRTLRSRFRWARPALEQIGVLQPVSFGLNGLDREILKYIRRRKGIFVEVGANDGLSQSNTAYLEFYLGWRGLLVEPIPELAAICRMNRPNSLVEEFALVEEGGGMDVVQMTYCNLMSIVSGAKGSAEGDEAHITHGTRFLAPGDQVRKVNVPTATLGDLLVRNGIDHVDFLSLDVEGMEAQALTGLDFDQVSPHWILVEANNGEAIEAVLKGRYKLAAHLSPHDRLYRLIQ